MRVDLSSLSRMRLSGDEDTGVGLGCWDCDRGGLPIAYYEGISPAYRDVPEVVQVDSISGLLLAAVAHLKSVHGALRPTPTG